MPEPVASPHLRVRRIHRRDLNRVWEFLKKTFRAVNRETVEYQRPLFVNELAVHPEHQGVGIGGFILEQLEHLARVRGCTHLVLEVAENNANALHFYRSRSFYKLDSAIFLAKRVPGEAELLPPRKVRRRSVAPAPSKSAQKPRDSRTH